MEIGPKTLAVLEWNAILAALGDRCDSVLGRERALSLRFFDGAVEVREELDRVRELWRLADEGRALVPIALADVRPALSRAEREGILDAGQLREIGIVLHTARAARRHLADNAALAPKLAALAAELDSLPEMLREIDATVDERGEVRDDATPELRRLRDRHRGLQTRTKARIDEMLHSSEFEKVLQDDYVTVREGRYVLPFVASVHKQLRGIVHHKSQSGATAFMETPELMEMNNRLTMAALEVEGEVERILRELTLSVCAQIAVIARDLEILLLLDVLQAKTRLGHDLGGTLPEVDDAGTVHLRGARHPLLALSRRPVVENELRLEAARGLVITGPNTGGKTVALKALGLAALMTAAGLPIPAAPDSRVPLYRGVFADIGDDQSIERSLSTFSAHLTHIQAILESVRPGALVLLDELCVGTDPHEGAALAAALLDAFVEKECSLVVTTHYEELKAKAHFDRRFLNASFGYDPVTFAPSYKLTSGVPGRSGAIDVASRLGLDSTVVRRAREVLGDRGRLDEVIAALESERGAVAAAHEEATRRNAEFEAERERLEAARVEMERHRGEAFEEARRQFLEELAQAREEVRAAIRALQEAPTPQAVQVAQERIAGAVAETRAHRAAPAPAAPRPPEITPGRKLYVRTFGRNGVVLEVMERRQQAVVDMGGARVVVPVAVLGEAEPEAVGGGARYKPPRAPATDDDSPVRTPDITCDLRGMRTEDALPAAESFLDRALGQDRSVVFFIHGHGTGALKGALRRFLKESPYVCRFREGKREEGGDGVTLAWLTVE
jgi:DNA mismatch repair protein MutS2